MAFNISYIYRAVDRFTPVAEKVSKSVDKLKQKTMGASDATQKLNDKLNKNKRALDSTKESQDLFTASISKYKMAAMAAAGAGVVASIKSFANYETALLGVAKTADIEVGPTLNAMGKKFVDLSKKIPVSAVELLNLGQTAAQLGVTGKDNILKFAETIAKLTRVSNIVGEEGAADLARLIKITGGDNKQVDRYASAIVALGNTTAATESEILGFATRLSGNAAIFGITGTQALGLAAALKALGVEAEEGSSSVGRGLGAINKVILEGGKKAAFLAKITGIAQSNLKKAFKEDSLDVLTKFSIGMDKMIESGADATKILALFGLEGVRDLKTLGLMAKNSADVAAKIDQASDAFKKNIALQREFEIQTQSLSNKWAIFKNLATAGAIQIGMGLAPYLEFGLDFATYFLKGLEVITEKLNQMAGWFLRPFKMIWNEMAMAGDAITNTASSAWTTATTPAPINNRGSESTINGKIVVEAAPGSRVVSTRSESNGNKVLLGHNMMGALM